MREIRARETVENPLPKSKPENKGRSLWWRFHSWAGLSLSIFITWVLLTGTLAVFSSEMDWLTNSGMRVAPQSLPYASWGRMVEEARSAIPTGRVRSVYAGPHRWFAFEALVEIDPDRLVRVYLNPYSGEVQGTGSWINFQRFFREMHRHLLLPQRWGIPIVCTSAIFILISIITGLVSYKKFWRNFFKMPRWGRNLRTLVGDLHRLVGLWSIWFVAIIALTGLWYFIEELGGEAPDFITHTVTQRVDYAVNGRRIDRLVRTAIQAYPDLDVKGIRLATKPQDALQIFGQGTAILVRDRANSVWLDPLQNSVIEVYKGEQLSLHQRISEMADPLHFGTWGGMATKILWFIFGSALTSLSITGVIIYSSRLKAAQNNKNESDPKGLKRAWIGMGPLAYPAAAIVILSLALLPNWLMK